MSGELALSWAIWMVREGAKAAVFLGVFPAGIFPRAAVALRATGGGMFSVFFLVP